MSVAELNAFSEGMEGRHRRKILSAAATALRAESRRLSETAQNQNPLGLRKSRFIPPIWIVSVPATGRVKEVRRLIELRSGDLNRAGSLPLPPQPHDPSP